MGGWFRNEIKSADDFKGIKKRSQNYWCRNSKSIRRNSCKYAYAGEIMPALQQGVIDAAEWVGPWVDKISGFHKKLLSIIMVWIHEPGTANELIMDLSKWTNLSNNLKEIIINVCHSYI